MLKQAFFVFFIFVSAVLSAQNSAKKYVLIEHFTNSKCSVCASRNPAFYNLISQPQYASEIHHISIHPPVPYNSCEFYLANTAENVAWANLYNIPGTPRVALNGHLINASSQLLRQDTLLKYLNQTSPLALQVTETGNNAQRTATVNAKTLSALPAGSYKLFVAVVEKTINKTTPNGETVHHDVFRDMLTPVEGQDFIPPAPGQNYTLNFPYSIQNTWDPNEVYVVAFVKETTSNLVLNSGTKFDPQTLDVQALPTQSLQLSPNPASETTYAYLSDDEALRTEMYTLDGKRVSFTVENQSNTVEINGAALKTGVYVVKITGKKAAYTGKVVIQH